MKMYYLLPKGIMSPVYKIYLYFIPVFLLVSTYRAVFSKTLVISFVLWFIFELILNVGRYQINDSLDYEGDKKRGYFWNRFVNSFNYKKVALVGIGHFVIGIFLAFFLNPLLGSIALCLVLQQILYDFFAKRFFPNLGVLLIAVGYLLRSLTIYAFFKINLTYIDVLFLLSMLCYSLYMVIQWKTKESAFIYERGIFPKPHSNIFLKPIYSFLKLFLMFSFIIIVAVILSQIFRIESYIFTLLSILLLTVFMLVGESIKIIFKKQAHNFLFLLVGLSVSKISEIQAFIVIFLIIISITSFHRSGVLSFSKDYFLKNKK